MSKFAVIFTVLGVRRKYKFEVFAYDEFQAVEFASSLLEEWTDLPFTDFLAFKV